MVHGTGAGSLLELARALSIAQQRSNPPMLQMNLDMSRQFITASEATTALHIMAFVWFLAGMRAIVTGEMLLSNKRFPAIFKVTAEHSLLIIPHTGF